MSIRISRSVFVPALIFAALQILPACRNGSDQGETEGVWAKVEFRPLKIKKSTEPVDLNRSVYLNEVYRSFSRLETSRDLVYQKYRYGLSGIRILSGEAKRKRGILDIRGESIVFALEVDPELLKAASLELLEMEVQSPEDLTVKIFDATGTGDSIENPGNFIFEKFIPGQDRPGFQKAQIDLGQRFGWEKKEVRRLIVKINPPQAESIRVKVRNLVLLSRNVGLLAEIPTCDYYRYGGADRRRLKSILLPAGTSISYQFRRAGNRPLVMDGYFVCAGGESVSFNLSVNGESLKSQTVTEGVIHFREELNPPEDDFSLKIEVSGEQGQVGGLGDFCLYSPPLDKKNVVYYMVDALRADLGGADSTLFSSHFSDGAVFRNAYANATRTADSLPALFSGKYKFMLVEKSGDVPFLSNREFLLAEYFKSKGYMTAAFINNPWLSLSNSIQGFDHVNFCWNPVAGYSHQPDETNYNRAKYGDMGDFLDRFIEENKDKPLFIYIHTMEPHIPYEVPLPWRAHSRDIPPDTQRDLYEKFAKSPPYPSLADPTEAQVVHMKNIYRDSVLAASRHFKKMKAALEKRGVLDDSSLLILSSDHGERFFEHKSWIHGPPDIYNEVLRIPLMIKGRGIRAGVYGHPVQLIDIFPTVMEWLGDSPNKLLPGVSLFETWKSGGILSADRPIYSDGTGDRPQYAVIKNGIKVIIDARGEEVYNLNRDPFERDIKPGLSLYRDLILETKDFQGRFKKILDRISRGLSAEERDRLRTLGYIH